MMNADGSGAVRLTSVKGRDAHPYFSKDGKRIVFAADGDGPSAIVVVGADGSNLVRLTQ